MLWNYEKWTVIYKLINEAMKINTNWVNIEVRKNNACVSKRKY